MPATSVGYQRQLGLDQLGQGGQVPKACEAAAMGYLPREVIAPQINGCKPATSLTS